MKDNPIRATNGELLCSKCHIPLIESKTPFHFKGQYIGQFDALVCQICRYSLLTSSGYDKAMETTKSFGLVGPAQTISEVIEEGQEKMIVQYVVASSLRFANLQKDSKKDNRVESENSNEQIVILKPYENYTYSKRQVLLLKPQ